MLNDEFSPSGIYLNTATTGLAPVRAVQAVTDALAAWQHGRIDPVACDADVEAARASFARLAGTPLDTVAVAGHVSALVGLVAAAVPDGAEVLCAEGEFTSVLFPFLAQERRGVKVRAVPLDRLADEVRPETHLVAVSHVQSADGAVLDCDALVASCASHGSQTLVDVTQSCGWLPVEATRWDYTVCGTYKWLLCPRGTAFFAVAPQRWDELIPHHAGWYGGDKVWESIYGTPLRLAANARRFDLSPAWLLWAGARWALDAIERAGVDAIGAHNIGLANRFRAGLDLAGSNSAVVSLRRAGVEERLAAAGIRCSTRAGAARLSFHLYNSEADVDAALAAVTG